MKHIRIISAEKETETFFSGGKEVEVVVVAVVYKAIIQIGDCTINGTFRFPDDAILEEDKVIEKIGKLFR